MNTVELVSEIQQRTVIDRILVTIIYLVCDGYRENAILLDDISRGFIIMIFFESEEARHFVNQLLELTVGL